MQISESKQVLRKVIEYRWYDDIKKLASENGSIQILGMKDNFYFFVYWIEYSQLKVVEWHKYLLNLGHIEDDFTDK